MRKPLLLALTLVSMLSVGARASSVLDVGTEYRLRGLQFTNATYSSQPPAGSGNTTDWNYYSQRGRVYVKAKLDPGIEIGSVLQAIGVSGSTVPLIGRYPKEDFTPFVEGLYIQANEFHDWPLRVTLGRQPYSWGTGMLLSDDGIGFDGIRLDAGPFWGVNANLFTAKAKENVGGPDSDVYLAGLSTAWGIHNIRVGWIMENDRTGAPYSNLTSTTAVASDKIVRQFYDVQLSGKLEKGAFYQLEYAMQGGKANLPGQEITLSGSALTFEGGFDFIHPRYKRMILAFVFMQGSGDDATTANQDERFLPTFGHKFDGLERAGAGDFFAATPYSFYNENRALVAFKDNTGAVNRVVPYDSLLSGLRTFGFRGSVNPWDPFTAGLEFYLYTARELPTGPNALPDNDNSLGRELVISAAYDYAKRIHFALRWGKFFASPTLGDVGASRLMFEASARF